MHTKRWIAVVVVVVAAAAVAAAAIAVAPGTPEDTEGTEAAPAALEPLRGTDVSAVTLSPRAVHLLGVRTAPIVRRAARRALIPYDAVLYAADGSTFTYTSPAPRVFVRKPIRVGAVRGRSAVLLAGPPAGTPVVVVGSQELFGTEFEVGED